MIASQSFHRLQTIVRAEVYNRIDVAARIDRRSHLMLPDGTSLVFFVIVFQAIQCAKRVVLE